MMNKKIEAAFNRQINAETYSGFLYLAMSAYAEAKGLAGAASWLRNQYHEEMIHTFKFVDFIHERGGRVTYEAIEAPPAVWESPRAVFEAGLAHEEKVSGLINDLVDLSIAEKDHAANTFLQWFVSEQVEEESSFQEILDKFDLGGDHPGFLFLLDAELGKRPTASYDTAAAE